MTPLVLFLWNYLQNTQLFKTYRLSLKRKHTKKLPNSRKFKEDHYASSTTLFYDVGRHTFENVIRRRLKKHWKQNFIKKLKAQVWLEHWHKGDETGHPHHCPKAQMWSWIERLMMYGNIPKMTWLPGCGVPHLKTRIPIYVHIESTVNKYISSWNTKSLPHFGTLW